MAVPAQTIGNGAGTAESAYAWLRLVASVLLGTIGSVGMWSFVVALPAVQADFGVTRADASLPYTLTMIGFGAGAVVHRRPGRPVRHRRAADRRRRLLLGLGFIASGARAEPHRVRAGQSG